MKKKNISHKSQTDQTDWDRVDKLGDKDIDFSDNPEVTAEMFAKAVLREGLKPVVRKTQVTLRVDEDVLTWFKKQGKGYQTRINSLLKAYKEAHQNDSSEYIDWPDAEAVVLPRLKPSTRKISIRLPESMIEELKVLANKRDVPYQSLLKIFLSERINSELHQ